jgi:predicted TIM-barrel fold metal-dependent hydrolase
MGLNGVKLHPYVECFRPDHPFFEKFFSQIFDLNLVILLHTGTLFSSPGHLKPILKNYPDLKIILAHLQEGCVPLMREYENVYSDTSGTRVYLLEHAVETCEDRILFGSDYPYLNYRVQMEVVKASNIPEKVKTKILEENFKNFLL